MPTNLRDVTPLPLRLGRLDSVVVLYIYNIIYIVILLSLPILTSYSEGEGGSLRVCWVGFGWRWDGDF